MTHTCGFRQRNFGYAKTFENYLKSIVGGNLQKSLLLKCTAIHVNVSK